MKRQQQAVAYDEIAPTFDQRYVTRTYSGVTSILHSLTKELNAEQILEVGCGTGHWLSLLQDGNRQVFGVDLSPGMLKEAWKKNPGFYLACGQAWELPYPDSLFDLIFCVNAFHHFAEPERFIQEAWRLLHPGGALAIIGMDPHAGKDHWYIYDYFEGTVETDLQRFPSSGRLVDWMASTGLDPIKRQVVERMVNEYSLHSMQEGSFLRKNHTSQLILLSDESYTAGLRRIERALAEAQKQGKPFLLPVDISLVLVCGYKK